MLRGCFGVRLRVLYTGGQEKPRVREGERTLHAIESHRNE